MAVTQKRHGSPAFRYRFVIASFALIAAILFIYVQVGRYKFIELDDDKYVYNNPVVTRGVTTEGISWAFTKGYASNWHPLTWLSHMLDCELFGLNPAGHHLTSVAIHTATALLLLLLMYLLAKKFYKSVFVAFVFAVHPLRVESVAWVSERKDVLSAFFWMLTIVLYYYYIKRPSKIKYIAVLLSLILGLTAKPMLVTLPLILLVLDYWPLGRIRAGKDSFLTVPKSTKSIFPSGHGALLSAPLFEKLPLFAVAAVSGIVTFIVQHKGGAISSFMAYPLTIRLANATVSYAVYIEKTLVPCNLAVFYPYNPASLTIWKVTGAGLALAVISLIVLLLVKRSPYLLTGWAWFIITLAPVIGIVKVGSQSMADRYTYIPGIGLSIMVAWGVPRLIGIRRWKKKVLFSTSAAIIIVFAILARSQAGYWRDTGALYEHTLDVTSGNTFIHDNLGVYLIGQGRPDEAAEHFREALRINPDYYQSYNNLGAYLAGQNRLDEAAVEYCKALDIKPDFMKAHNNFGNTLSRMGKHGEAEKHLREALRLDPDYSKAHNNLAIALYRQGNFEGAIEHFSEAIRLKPDFTEAIRNLAIIRKEMDQKTGK